MKTTLGPDATDYDFVFMPKYIVETLKRNNITLDMLDSYMSIEGSSDFSILEFSKRLSSLFSNTDLRTIEISSFIIHNILSNNKNVSSNINKLINNNSYSMYNHRVGKLRDILYFAREANDSQSYFEDNLEIYNRVIQYLKLNYENPDILMSEVNLIEGSKVYDIVITQNTAFIVLHPGFTDLIIQGSEENRNNFILNILNTAIKNYRLNKLYVTTLFKKFIAIEATHAMLLNDN